jgi:D-alanyl-D-alanine endopeptidase (penicillin-binding protein 7)
MFLDSKGMIMKWYELIIIAMLGVFVNTQSRAEFDIVQDELVVTEPITVEEPRPFESTIIQDEQVVTEPIIVEKSRPFNTGQAKIPFKLHAQAALVLDANTGEVLYDKNSTEIRSIASITKLMSAVVILDANLSLDEEITITQEEVVETTVIKHGRKQANCGRSCLYVGLKLTRAEVLHLALMNSNNRAAYALGRSYPGGLEAFVAAMNAKAQMLGMDDTHYVDPTGLYRENVSTATDLAILLRHASDYVMIRDFSTSPSFALSVYNKKHRKPKLVDFKSTNRLVRIGTWDIILQKTGYIKDAGHCVAMMAQAGATKIMIILLNTVNNDQRADDAIRIKRYVETGEIPVQTIQKHRHKRRRV